MYPLLTALVLFAVCTVARSGWTSDSDAFREAHEFCLRDPICRVVYEQDHGQLSLQRFTQLAGRSLTNYTRLWTLVAETEHSGMPEVAHRLLVSSLIHDRLIFSDARCSPNAYWHWNEAEEQGECLCYLDRECRADASALCSDNVHPILLTALVLLALLIIADLVVHTIWGPRGSTVLPSRARSRRRKRKASNSDDSDDPKDKRSNFSIVA